VTNSPAISRYRGEAANERLSSAYAARCEPAPDSATRQEVEGPARALIIDRRAVLATEVCRALNAMGWAVDMFAERSSPALRSRCCHSRLVSPPWSEREAFLKALESTVDSGAYDAIFLGSEEILEAIASLRKSPGWKALLLPPPEQVRVILSKNAAIELARGAGAAIPSTVVPAGEEEVESLAARLQFPIVVKGEKGEATRNVAITRNTAQLLSAYATIASRERGYGGRPMLQEFIPGPQYSLGGLFHNGEPLRIFAYRKLFTYPTNGGLTVKAITERPPALLDGAFAVFKALRYTGLGQVQFIRDLRDGRFKFLEVNPRIWASIGLAPYAGVDLYTPYLALVRGEAVQPDLSYREGVLYHRITAELRLTIERPLHLFSFVRDCLDPRVRSDFQWKDPGPHLPTLDMVRRLFKRRKRT
jgi:D-aspartate ligase